MQTKAYKIGDCVIALESDGTIGDSRLYSKFLSDEKADITVETDNLSAEETAKEIVRLFNENC